MPPGLATTSRTTLDGVRYRPLYDATQRIAGKATNPVRSGGGDRGVAALERRLHLRRDPAARPGGPARPVRDEDEARVLPALRGRDGPHAALPRDSGTGGRRLHERDYDKEAGTWSVNDREAHTWVEVWFKGYGWLPFDPTPGRGTLGGPYTTSSVSFDAGGAAKVLAASALAGRSLLRFELGPLGKEARARTAGGGARRGIAQARQRATAKVGWGLR